VLAAAIPFSPAEMREHYDFSKGVRGKYAKRFKQGTNLVLLDPEVARAFPTSEAVNKALRKVMGLTRTVRALGGSPS
jgi:hypothetical protein